MIEEIGVIVVHGIGEQGRFEHLDGHIRGIINGLRRGGAEVTVEIMGSAAAAFSAQQETWRAGPHAALRLVVVKDAQRRHINVHEVWWADINERYSITKQIRFWAWGLSIWMFPARPSLHLPTSGAMFTPRAGKTPIKFFAFSRTMGSAWSVWLKEWSVRLRLFLVGCLFLLASLSIGIVMILAKRLLNIESPDVLKTLANYLSSVKLYNQARRMAPGLIGRTDDVVDNIGYPPRVSIRRRMIRTIADVACRDYARWYILAHSQGSVVAFNGLMEPAFGWPGYLDERRWRRLCAKGMAGPATPNATIPSGVMVPARPAWVATNEIAYRSRIFERFHGLLTYGCPLEKFAAIWPATVAVCREPAFQPQARWLNIFDPLDPVSGVMVSWPTAARECCPPAENVGYATYPLLLFGHTTYLDCPEPSTGAPMLPSDPRLADGVADWLVTDRSEAISRSPGQRFFDTSGKRRGRRAASLWLQGAFVFLASATLATLTLQQILLKTLKYRLPMKVWVSPFVAPTEFGVRVFVVIVLAVLTTLIFGLVFRAIAGLGSTTGDRPPDERFTSIASPEPPRRSEPISS